MSSGRWIENRVLATALAVSVGLHLVILTIRFVNPELLQQIVASPPLEVILVNARSEKRPANAQAHAQVNLDGGGANEQGRRTSPLPSSQVAIDGDALEAARRAVERLEQEQRKLLAAYQKNKSLVNAETRAAAASAAQEERREAQQPLARMQAEIDKEISDYQKRPRVHHYMPSTSEYRFARYFEDWRVHVEKVGNDHYPEAARGRIYGTVVVTVVIDRNGGLVQSIIERSSGSAVLDGAAQRIVKLSAPFAPFPPDMRDTDQIELTRSMVFTADPLGAHGDGGGLHVDKTEK
jgi:protein TonB